MLVVKVPEDIFYVIQSKITASSNFEHIAVSFSMDFTVKQSTEFLFFATIQFKEPFTSGYVKK